MATRRPKKTAAPRKKTAKRTQRPAKAERPIVIYVHGIGDHPPVEEFKHQWDLALFGQNMGDGTRMAYWADILHGKAGGSSKKKRGAAQTRDVDARSLLAQAELDPDDERALDFVESLAATLADPNSAGMHKRGVRSKVLPLPGFLRRPVARRLLEWFIKDTAAYFFDENKRARIQQRLIEQIPTSGEPFVLVTHSQGTVAAFEVLQTLDKRPEASLFVTMGSPLGLQEVQDLMRERGSTLQVPEGVRSWHNFADRLDPVAADASLDTDFAPRGFIHDHMIINERTRELLRFNPHSSVGYLANHQVRRIVHHGFGFDSAGRFIVARDVAEGFVDAGLRQPVLIEALHPGYPALGESGAQREQREKQQSSGMQNLDGRIDGLADRIRNEIKSRAAALGESKVKAEASARVQRLRNYVAAHLTPTEIAWLAEQHADLNVYAVWRSSGKSKLLHRSHAPLKVDAARASYDARGEGITWAVLDTGARWDHPHFTDADGNNLIIKVLDCTQDTDAPVPIAQPKRGDRDGHGTHVAGIIAGEHSDAENRHIQGVAPRARLLVYKVLDDNGFGEDAWIIKAIDDIYRRNDAGTGLHVHGVNLSLGGPFDATVYGCGYSPICKELRSLWRQGVLVCVAAGNEGKINVQTDDGDFELNTQLSIGDPANLEDCIAVGSVNADRPYQYGISYFSSRGPTADGRLKPDCVAPGERIHSANHAFRKRGRAFLALYRPESGTSMACPHVSGMLAAFLSVRREFIGRPDEVKKILLENCNDLGRDRYHQGAGMPNLMKMLLHT